MSDITRILTTFVDVTKRHIGTTNSIFNILGLDILTKKQWKKKEMDPLWGFKLQMVLEEFRQLKNTANPVELEFYNYMCESFWIVLISEIRNDLQRQYFKIFFPILNHEHYGRSIYAVPALTKVLNQQFTECHRLNSEFVLFLLQQGALIDSKNLFVNIYKQKENNAMTIHSMLLTHCKKKTPQMLEILNYVPHRQCENVSYLDENKPILWNSHFKIHDQV